jgi:hypothetical protein
MESKWNFCVINTVLKEFLREVNDVEVLLTCGRYLGVMDVGIPKYTYVQCCADGKEPPTLSML